MRRSGSALSGMSTIAWKEAADHFSSARFHFVMLLVINLIQAWDRARYGDV